MRKQKPSRTAYKVALNIVTLGTKPDMADVLPEGIVDATEQLLLASGGATPKVLRWARSPKMLSVYDAFDWMMPGQFEAFGHRKAFCERQVRDGIDAGATQILVLGAGYDTMGWRLAPTFSDVHFFEIDHPATARLKAKGIDAMGGRANLHLISEDLGQRRLVDVLEATGLWDPTLQTVIVAEGLLQYLPSAAVQELFRQCASVTGGGSRIAFTHIGAGTNGRPYAGRWGWLTLWILKVSGEPWLWSICPERLSEFLGNAGWSDAPELAGTVGKHGVEFFSVARRECQDD